MLETLLGEKVPEPPADAGTLDAEAGESHGKTLREELALHRRNVACASCHSKIDPIGFGLENFDAVGRFRAQEAGRPVDNSGVLPGGETFRGPAELKQIILKRKDAFVRNLVEQMLVYALGRELQHQDECTIREVTAALAKDGHRFATLVQAIVKSYPFRHRRNSERED